LAIATEEARLGFHERVEADRFPACEEGNAQPAPLHGRIRRTAPARPDERVVDADAVARGEDLLHGRVPADVEAVEGTSGEVHLAGGREDRAHRQPRLGLEEHDLRAIEGDETAEVIEERRADGLDVE